MGMQLNRMTDCGCGSLRSNVQSAGTAHVLVADDSLAVRSFISNTLSVIEGLVLLFAENGASAVDMLSTHHVDIVLLDTKMPRTDLIDTIHAMRRCAADVPILLLATRADREITVAAIGAGADTFLTKPLNGDLLLNAAQFFLGHRRDFHHENGASMSCAADNARQAQQKESGYDARH